MRETLNLLLTTNLADSLFLLSPNSVFETRKETELLRTETESLECPSAMSEKGSLSTSRNAEDCHKDKGMSNTKSVISILLHLRSHSCQIIARFEVFAKCSNNSNTRTFLPVQD